MENRLILAFPRSGTKLLASVHQQNGYHNFGEFFNSYSTVVLDHPIPRAVRMPIDHQRELISTKQKRGKELDLWTNRLVITHRLKKFNKFKSINPSITTVFATTFDLLPEAFELLNDREILCLRRNNRFDQLLSRSITKQYLNYDNEYKSRPTTIDLDMFKWGFYSLLKLERLQDFCVTTGRGKYVDFDKLILGQEDLGFSYTVNTIDQHSNLEELVLNLTEVKEIFLELKNLYNVNWD
jgi:hypothetical protein